jgi:2-C-methyl-D-erythritol 4-phosphate cytidylyltransferase/2-C-methyl-D-erythritol 2,4-cyclodiphosphate synthase
MKQPKVSAIICAAGKGERAGFGRNKLLTPLYGAPALYHTLKKFNLPEIDEVIVTSSSADLEEIGALCSPLGYKVVLGGETRTESVRCALKSVTGDIVLIHDGARPFVTHELIDECIESVKHFGSGICSLHATDTAVYGNYGVITEGLDRSCLYLLQTPQGFLTDEITNAYNMAGDKQYTDDSAVYSEFIATPRLIAGSRDNIKLTYKQDFQRKYTPFRPLPMCAERVGFGVDVHTFGTGDGVTLCGVKIPCDKRLIAHSDGDVAIHAIMDALLSAAGLNDIGHYFPDTDQKYKGADSSKMLSEVVKLILDKGYMPLNLSVSIQAEKPRLAKHIDEMKSNLSRFTGISTDNIAIAAGTCEGLGFVGEGLGITAYCTAMLRSKA